MPDDELLDLAASGRLRRREVFDQQVRRMLADERSHSLVTSFSGQWLYLQHLDSVVPDMRLYPEFDDNLRQALLERPELFVRTLTEKLMIFAVGRGAAHVCPGAPSCELPASPRNHRRHRAGDESPGHRTSQSNACQ